MRIAFLITHFPPKWLAGTEIVTYDLVKELARRGHEVHVITLYDRGVPEEKEEIFFMSRIRLPLPLLIPQIPLYFLKVLREVRRINPEVIHVQALSINAVFAMLICGLIKRPYIVWAQGTDVNTSNLIKIFLGRYIIKNAFAVIGLTVNMRNKIEEIYRGNIIVIPNGIDLKRFKLLSRDSIADSRSDNSIKIILFVGTLRKVKGVRYAIESMKELQEKNYKNVKLLIAGDGEERSDLEILVKELDLEDYVQFIGKVPNTEIPKYMKLADIFLLPSLSEGFPITCLEAMAAGLPIVATSVTGMNEIIKEGINGFLVEPRTPNQISQRIISLLGDDNLRAKMSINNLSSIDQYSIEYIAQKLEKIYLETKEVTSPFS